MIWKAVCGEVNGLIRQIIVNIFCDTAWVFVTIPDSGAWKTWATFLSFELTVLLNWNNKFILLCLILMKMSKVFLGTEEIWESEETRMICVILGDLVILLFPIFFSIKWGWQFLLWEFYKVNMKIKYDDVYGSNMQSGKQFRYDCSVWSWERDLRSRVWSPNDTSTPNNWSRE